MVHPLSKTVLRALAGVAAGLLVILASTLARADANHVRLSALLDGPAEAGKTDWAVIRFNVDPHWHIYWQNPGDTGLPTQISWRLPPGISAGAINWPAPARFAADGIVNFGYSGVFALLVPLNVAPNVQPHGQKASATVSWLACAEMCVPEQSILSIPLDDNARSVGTVAAAFAALPKPLPGIANVSVLKHTLVLTVAAPALRGVDAHSVNFFPDRTGLVDYDAPSMTRVSNGRITIRMVRGRAPVGLVSGILTVGNGGSFAISAVPVVGRARVSSRPDAPGFFAAIALAFVGGLVLNLMPCVLPVLSMKAIAFAQGGARSRRRDGVAYFAGAFVTFLAIAAVLLMLKTAGAAVGWGFQLQSPGLVFMLFLLMSAIGLNLLGLFELPSGFAGVGEVLTRGNTPATSFFTGALAVLVASPCTAPFMAAELGYALTQPAPVSLCVFAALATGFAAPFTALSFLPGIYRIIPKPGSWMVRFRQLLAFPMLATAVWLLWVLDVQLGSSEFALVLAAALGLAFLIWAARHTRRGLRGAALGAAVSLVLWTVLALQPAAQEAGAEAVWQRWSPHAVDEARHARKPVLVDFTAAWCVTCLVNERVALEDTRVVSRLRQDGVVLLKGDWTGHDAAIATELKRNGREGVPLYLLYPRGGDVIVLPQILTADAVLDALEKPETAREHAAR